MSTKHTFNQQLAIDTRDGNIIVSAGAGAGKTSTLVERVYTLITTGNPPVSVDKLLVVTFTRAAAQEMKTRLSVRLATAMNQSGISADFRLLLRRQQTMLGRANISTIHSFLLQLITAHPDEVGLAPGFELMSEEESRLFRSDFLRNKMEETLGRGDEDAAVLRRLLEYYDPLTAADQVLAQIERLHNFLSALPDHEKFAEASIRLNSKEGSEALLKAFQGEKLKTKATQLINLLEPICALNAGNLHKTFAPQWEYFQRNLNWMKQLLAEASPIDWMIATGALAAYGTFSSPRTGMTETCERFKALREPIKKPLKDFQSLVEFILGEIANPDSFTVSAKNIHSFVSTFGVKWYGDLFNEHIELRRLTFAHLERLALRLLIAPDGSPTAIARLYRQQLAYILIDEFQDVNELQYRIIRALSRPKAGGTGNLFMVGDIKQSIYAFRQAEPQLFLDVYNASRELAPGLPTPDEIRISLRENFRTHGLLLAEFNSIFSHLLTWDAVGINYAAEHAFVAGRDEARISSTIQPNLELCILPKSEELSGQLPDNFSPEAAYTASVIKRIGPPWNRIAVLLRSASSTATDLVAALDHFGIPYHTQARIGFLEAVEILEFRSILATIDNPYDDMALLGLLRGPAWRWNENELLQLRHVNKRQPLYTNLHQLAGEATGLGQKARAVELSIRKLQDIASRESMARFFSILFEEFDLIEQASVRPGGEQRRLNLLQMLEHARLFDGFLRKGLGEFLRFLQDLLEQGGDFAPPAAIPPDANMVRIMTVHASKGMEFEAVVVPYLGRQFNLNDMREAFLFDRKLGASTRIRDVAAPEEKNDPLLFKVMAEERRQNNLREELRLLYVALTRARESITLIGTDKETDNSKSDEYEGNEQEETEADTAELFSAKGFLDWLKSWASVRFPQRSTTLEGAVADDGIAHLRIYNPEYLSQKLFEWVSNGNAAPVPAEGANPSEDRAAFEEALARIRSLSERPQLPHLRAKLSVSEAKRLYEAHLDPDFPPFPAPPSENEGHTKPKLEEWRSDTLRDKVRDRRREKGTLVHRFLSLVDFHKLKGDQWRLSDELNRMVAEEYIKADELELLLPPMAPGAPGNRPMDDIAWFLNTELGKDIRKKLGVVHRERPFTVRIDAAELLQAGAAVGALPPGLPILFQGVIDLLYEGKNGWVIVDYKTDQCGPGGERIPLLRKSYDLQMILYRLLVERTLNVTVDSTWLVFLQGRSVQKVEETNLGGSGWAEILASSAVTFPAATLEEPSLRSV